MSDRHPPSPLLRLFFKAPVVLYRLRMGWLLGSRFLLLTHTGRRTGQTRQTVLEVVGYDRSIREAVVIAAWGERAQWLRNLEASPAISVQIGRTRWATPEHRVLDAEQTAEVIATYRREHSLIARLIGKLLGWPLDVADPSYEQFVKTLCAVVFRPAEKGD
ncbi:MAG: nitroreductase family deazaflavin-dependent oxidoreductase [Solirubrobacteraceae bacterium]